MGIIFKEDRELPGGGCVEGGKVYDTFSAEDEQAFVGNGVADFAPQKDGKKLPTSDQGGE
jgi:hypothetical protein